MDGHNRLLAAFLAGELEPADARLWDEHLLDCEQCWRAVREDRAGRQAARLLRQPPPPGLADRIAFAIEMAAADGSVPRRIPPAGSRPWRRGSRGKGLRWRPLAGAAALATGLVTAVAMLLLPAGRRGGDMPAAVAAVAHYAQAVSPLPGGSHPHAGSQAIPVQVGGLATLTAGGQQIVMRTWRLRGTEAVVAVSRQPFPMPARAQATPSSSMAWTAQLGTIRLYCLNGQTSELVAGPLPLAQLATLAARLPEP